MMIGTEPDAALDDIVRLAALCAATPVAVIAFPAAEQHRVKARVGIGLDAYAREGSPCELVIRSGAPVASGNLQADARFASAALEDAGIRFYAGTPILANDGEAIGTLWVADHAQRELTADQRFALQTLARQAGALLQPQGSSASSRNISSDVRERMLRDAAAGLFRASSTAEAVSAVLKIVCESTAWEIGAAWLSDGDVLRAAATETDALDAAAAAAFREDARQRTFAHGEGVPGAVWRAREPRWITALNDDAEFRRRELAAATGIVSAAAFPIIVNEHVFGILEVFSREVRQPDPDLLDAMHALGRQLGQFTARKHAEESLAWEHAVLRGITEGTSDSIFAKDHEGRYLLVNTATAKILGRDAAAIRGRHDGELFDEASVREIVAHDQLVMSTGEVSTREERLTFGERTCTFLATKAPLRNAAGDVIGLVGVSRDITERKEIEATLTRTNALYSALVESVGAVVWRGGGTPLRFEFISAAARRLIGITADEWVGNPEAFFTNIHPDDRECARSAYDAAVSKPGEHILEYRVSHSGLWVRDVVRTRSEEGRLVATGVMTDVSAQKRTELQLREAEELFRLAAGATGDVIYDWRIDDDRIWWSPNAANLFGSLHRIGSTLAEWERLVHPDDRARVGGALDSALAGTAMTWVDNYRIRRVDGSYAHVHERGHFVRNDEGRVVRMIGVIADVSDVVLATEGLRQSEERYRSVVEAASEIIFELDGDSRIRSLNSAFERVTGWPREQWIGRQVLDLIDAQDVPAVLRALARGRADQVQELELRARTARDGVVTLDVSLTFAGESDDPGSVYGVARDVTERKSAAAERERLARQVQLLLESTTEGIYGTDVEGRCTFINNAAANLLGYEPADLLGQQLHQLIHHVRTDGSSIALEDCAILQTARHGTALRRDDEVFWTSDGRMIPVEYSASPVIESGVPIGIVVTFSSIAERLIMQRRLEEEKRLSSLGRLAASVSHEFNNVLMAIQPQVEIARKFAGDAERTARAIETIGESLRRGKNVAQEILRFSRTDPPARAVFAAAPWLAAFVEEHQKMLPETVELHLSTPPYELFLDCDRDQIHQVLSNLVINARDAIGGARGRIDVTVEPCESWIVYPFGQVPTQDAYARIAVADDGPGMSEEVLSQVFEPMFTTKKTGAGLGLAISHSIVTRNGGYIFAESQPGHGTMFHVLIPLGVAAAVEQTANTTDEPLSGLRVLLVEDDDTVAAGLMQLLVFGDAEAMRAATGREALALFAQHEFDFVLLDVDLPDTSGTAVFEAIRETRPSIPVIFSTGDASQNRLQKYLERESVAVLFKPYDLDDLLRTAARLRGLTD